LVCHDWGGLLGLPIAAEFPEHFDRLVIMNTGLPTGEKTSPAFMEWRTFASKATDMDIGRVIQRGTVRTLSMEVISAYNAPFQDATYKAGAHQFPLLVPISPDAPASAPLRKARELLSGWTKPTLVMFSDKDPITAGGGAFFRKLIPAAAREPEIVIQDGGHFLQEDKGEEIAEHIRQFLERRPIV
jgi:haloalkane dehalogenase